MAVSAIGNQALNNQALARRVYLDYVNNGGKTYGANADDAAMIKSHYGDATIKRWIDWSLSNDENEYHISDEEFNVSLENGKDKAEKKAGNDYDDSGDSASNWETVGMGAVGLGALTTSYLGIKALLAAVKKTNANKGKLGLQATICAAIEAGILLAAALLLKKINANAEQAKACDVLKDDLLPTAQEEMQVEQDNMAAASEAASDASSEAADENENGNAELEEKKTLYDNYLRAFLELQRRAKTGELTPEEKELYKTLCGYLSELGIEIEELEANIEAVVNDIYENMEDYIDVFETSIQKFGEIQGITDYASSFDEGSLANTEMVKTTAQIAGWAGFASVSGAASTGIATAGFFDKIAAVIIGTAAILVAYGAKATFDDIANKQEGYGARISEEIEKRNETIELNTGAMEDYENRIVDYDGDKKDVEGLEVKVPEHDPPSDTTLPTPPNNGTGGEGSGNNGGNSGNNGGTGGTGGAGKTGNTGNNNPFDPTGVGGADDDDDPNKKPKQ